MWQIGGVGHIFSQFHHFVKFNQGKSPRKSVMLKRRCVCILHSVLDHRLADHECLANDYSMADIATWPWVMQGDRSSIIYTPTRVPVLSTSFSHRIWCRQLATPLAGWIMTFALE